MNTPEVEGLIAHIASLVEPYLPANKAPSRDIDAGVSLRELGVTSLQLVEIVLDVDTKFLLQLDESEITPENFRSVASIAALVARKSPRAALARA